MNEAQRKEIYNLRLQGLGYKAIARELGISSDAVKGYCKRNHLNGSAEVIKLNVQLLQEENKLCPCCCKPVKQSKQGRIRRFCSDECRRKWWNENPDKRSRKEAAIYKYTCPYCNKEFSCYGNKRRKYCSHNCYIKSRFWKGDADDRTN